MAETETKYTVLPDSTVAKVETVEVGERTPPVGPTPRQAQATNERLSKVERLKAQRTAIILEALERRRQAREQEFETALASAREQAGTAEEQIENGWISASDVVVPPEYQRVYDDKKARGYAMRFSWRKFRSVAVNRRPDGTLALVDGQHRLRAAQMLFGPDVQVPCTFTHAETTVEEARDFDGINTDRSSLGYNAAFRARIHGKDPQALQVQAILRTKGLRPLWPGENRGLEGTVTATRTIEYMVKAAGESSAKAVVGILYDVWGRDPNGYRDFILNGLWQFLVRYDGYLRRDRIVTVLSRLKSPADMDDLTKEQRTGVNSSAAVACCGAIHYLYNYQMKAADALPPFSVETPARYSSTIRRSARSWVVKHEGGNGGAKRSGVWANGAQLPYQARKRDRSPSA
jgi:hypothetical protein